MTCDRNWHFAMRWAPTNVSHSVVAILVKACWIEKDFDHHAHRKQGLQDTKKLSLRPACGVCGGWSLFSKEGAHRRAK